MTDTERNGHDATSPKSETTRSETTEVTGSDGTETRRHTETHEVHGEVPQVQPQPVPEPVTETTTTTTTIVEE